ncbi:MAG: hypothetical protein AAFQ82_02950, partial [Myxococcota bacterium]
MSECADQDLRYVAALHQEARAEVDRPELAAMISMLNRFRKKLAVMAGDDEDDYIVVLADGPLAMIDELGTIYFGAGFLMQCRDVP